MMKCEGNPMNREWLPIDTAPRDGRWVILCKGEEVRPGYWGPTYFGTDHGWITYSHRSDYEESIREPTHWMPLPAANL